MGRMTVSMSELRVAFGTRSRDKALALSYKTRATHVSRGKAILGDKENV